MDAGGGYFKNWALTAVSRPFYNVFVALNN